MIDHDEVDVLALELLSDGVQVHGVAGQAIEFGDDKRVAIANVLEHAREFGSVTLIARNFLLKYFTATGSCEFGALLFERLTDGGDARIADAVPFVSGSR